MSLFDESKRRNVIRTGIACLALSQLHAGIPDRLSLPLQKNDKSTVASALPPGATVDKP